MKLRSAGASIAAVIGVLASVALAPATVSAGAHSSDGSGTRFAHASTSTRGVVGNEINVVFPVVTLNSIAGKYGVASDAEYGEQTKAIKFFVGLINKKGIDGRKINAIISYFNPETTAQMRSLCKDWTEGSPAAFAVIDGVGTWNETNQLCVAKTGETPLISEWTTVSTWTTKAAPYLWWTGPDDSAIIQATVNWGLSTGLLGSAKKVAVIAGSRTSDQLALNKYLLPDLKRAGVHDPLVENISSLTTTAKTATSNATVQAPLIIQKLQSAGVTSVIPLVPFPSFITLMSAETSQHYFPKLLLSDYTTAISDGLGLIPTLFETAVNDQEGVTTETLGGIDDNRPEKTGGYDPGDASCFRAWHKAYPNTLPHAVVKGAFIEEQGPVQAWCTSIRLFAQAATAAGKTLNRKTFVTAMSKVKNFPGGYSKTWSFGKDKFSGPTQYQVVEIHNNVPPSSQCKLPFTKRVVTVCWVQKQPWQTLPTG